MVVLACGVRLHSRPRLIAAGTAKLRRTKRQSDTLKACTNTSCIHLCRLLHRFEEAARRHGVPAHSVTVWVRRKLGADITVVRQRCDGSLGCAAPCVLCAKQLLRFDLRVHCSLSSGALFSGRLTDCGAPRAKLTKGQRRALNKWSGHKEEGPP